MISFIVSSNSNIQKIKYSLENISNKFGNKIKFDNQEFFLFPKPSKLAKASISEIKSCGVGYHVKFIKEAANMTLLKKINFESMKKIVIKKQKKKFVKFQEWGIK